MKRDFKGVWIPKSIWVSRKLTLQEKVFLVEIDSLDNDDGCFASNAYFADFFSISKGRCTQIIKSLETKGFISVSLIRKNNSISKRIIKVFNKLNTPLSLPKQGYLENDDDNNTSINNKDILNIIVEFINSNYNRKFKPLQSLLPNLNARIKDGYTEEDIKTAITNAHNSSYHKETKYIYLTPEFFLRDKMLDKWLNASPIPNDYELITTGVYKGMYKTPEGKLWNPNK